MMISLSLFAFLFTQLASIKMNTIPVIVSFSFIARFETKISFFNRSAKSLFRRLQNIRGIFLDQNWFYGEDHSFKLLMFSFAQRGDENRGLTLDG